MTETRCGVTFKLGKARGVAACCRSPRQPSHRCNLIIMKENVSTSLAIVGCRVEWLGYGIVWIGEKPMRDPVSLFLFCVHNPNCPKVKFSHVIMAYVRSPSSPELAPASLSNSPNCQGHDFFRHRASPALLELWPLGSL